MNLQGKHILVTGASSGIGRMTAKLAAERGAVVFAVARRKEELQLLISELPNNGHQLFVCDLTKENEITCLTNLLMPVDGIVHAAGIVAPKPIKYIRKKDIEPVWNINAVAPILLTSGLLSEGKINNKASLVFLSSVSTDHPYFGGAMYVSSKAAIEAFSRNLALELASKRIRSNVLAPALVKTSIYDETVKAASVEELAKYEAQYPLGIGEPEDVAEAALFFLSDQSKWITGQKLVMDGGLTLNGKHL